jgi:hypothetical protein
MNFLPPEAGGCAFVSTTRLAATAPDSQVDIASIP